MSSPEQKLKRFLHYGKEIPLYQPGDCLHDSSYHPSELSSVEAMIASEKFTDPPGYIVKALRDGYSVHPEMLVYALAICAKQKTSVQMSSAAYKAFSAVCATPENMFLFIKFAKMQPNKSVWGSGMRKVLKEWYLNKEPKALAEIVTRRKRYHGWSHKDVMKLIHLKTDDPARAAIIKYVLYDLATAKKEYGEVPGTSEILNYIQSIEDFKHMTDEQQAARTLETLNLTMEHIPSHLLKSKEIWNALIGTMPLGVLLENLERMGYLGFFKLRSTLVTRVLDALRDERSIAESHLHPAQVFVALRKYETSSKFMAAQIAQDKRKTENGSGEVFPPKVVGRLPPRVNMKIVVGLYELFRSTCKLFLAPTGMRYLVVIDKKKLWASRLNDKCYRCPHVTPSEAAVVTTLCLLHADRNVDVRGPSQNDLVPLPITSSTTIQTGIWKLNEFKDKLSDGLMSPVGAVKWALQKKQEYDVIVYITDYIKGDNNVILSTLNQYRTDMNLPNAKLIIITLTSHQERLASDQGIFYISGFDGNVPRIIEAFSRGAF